MNCFCYSIPIGIQGCSLYLIHRIYIKGFHYYLKWLDILSYFPGPSGNCNAAIVDVMKTKGIIRETSSEIQKDVGKNYGNIVGI